MILRITNGFDRLSDANLEVKANTIVTAMTGNTYFPTPNPDLPTLQAAVDAYVNALAVAKDGSYYDKAVKNQKRAALIELLHALGNYVLYTSNGDEVAARSSGFTIAKAPSPAPEVSKAENLQLSDGPNAGELQLMFNRVKGAVSYIYQCAPDPITADTVWGDQTGTVRKAVFSGLESRQKYWCRVVAVGIKGQQVASDAVARIVQ